MKSQVVLGVVLVWSAALLYVFIGLATWDRDHNPYLTVAALIILPAGLIALLLFVVASLWTAWRENRRWSR